MENPRWKGLGLTAQGKVPGGQEDQPHDAVVVLDTCSLWSY